MDGSTGPTLSNGSNPIVYFIFIKLLKIIMLDFTILICVKGLKTRHKKVKVNLYFLILLLHEFLK